MEYKAIIVDDEKNNRENLHEQLKQYCKNISITGLAASVDEAFEMIRKETPDLVFLDIKMPKKNGFTLLENIPDATFEVIITTAYNEFALKAIKFCAIDYLLKPINIIELCKAVDNATQKIESKKENIKLKHLVKILRNNEKPSKIALTSHHKTEFINIDSIIRCESDNNYTHVFIEDLGKITQTKTLKDFEDLLNNYSFLRINQSHLVNTRKIKTYHKNDGGYIEMIDGSKLPISRTRKQIILESLKKLSV